MKLRTTMTMVAVVVAGLFSAVSAQQPFKGAFYCKDANISIVLDLYEESLEAPDLSFLGKLHGYMAGRGVYGTWLVTDCKIEDKTATIRFSNDVGSDSQTIIFKQRSDSLFDYKAVGGNVIKKAVGRKLVKIEDELLFKRTR